MRKIRAELQVTPLEAGLCCAAMILHAYGCRTPTAELREELDLGRGGSSLPQLAELFVRRGIPAEAVQADAQTARELPGPFVVGWGTSTFVIIEKVTDKWVILMDPAIGRRKAPAQEFLDGYSGYYLRTDFENGRLQDTLVEREHPRPFTTAMRSTAGSLSGVAIMSIIIYATDIGAPYLTQKVIDQSLNHASTNLFTAFAPWVLGICAAVGVGIFLRSYFIAHSAVKIGRKTSESVLDHLLGLPFRYFDSRQPGELAYRLGGLSAIRDSLSDQLFTGFFQVGGMCVYLGYMFYRSVVLGLVSAAFVGLMLLVLFGSRKLFYSAIQNELSQTGRMQTEQLEAIQSILTIKTRPTRGVFLRKWRTQNEVSLGYLRRRMLLQGGVNAIVGILQFSGPVVTLLVGIHLWRQHEITLGGVFSALTVSSLLFATANAIYGSVALFLMCRTYARRVEDITMTEQAQVGTRSKQTLGMASARGVSFRYTKHAPDVVRDVDLDVLPGQTVAIVGRTGSGKSTLAKLLLGLYAPTKGRICYDRLDVADLDPACFFEKLSFVPQDVTLETATLHENLALGKDISREKVRWACRMACIDQEIETFPAGYDTMVNNLGANFSGGQRQRIAIARAVLNSPEILVLDEATSSLDSETEVSITTNLREMGITMIVIAHRLASVRDADVTYVMRDGQIVQSGRHGELIHSEGMYRSLFAPQTAA